MAGLARASMAAQRLLRQSQIRPADHVVPLPGQHAVLSDPSALRLFRGPQQAIGKTWAGALDCIGHMTGIHPWAPDEIMSPRPGYAWIMTASWSQSISVQGKLWSLLPKDLLHPDTVFDEIKGFRGTTPAFRIRHVPSGGWSKVFIRTTKQSGLDLSSASLTYAWFDEPPHSQRVFSEVHKRLLKAGRYGRLLLTMTPINAKIEWLKDEVENGRLGIVDHHHRLEPQELIPVGRRRPIVLQDGTVCDERWVQAQILGTLEHEVPVVCHGEWRMTADAPIFTHLYTAGSKSHVLTEYPTAAVDLYLGIDHGLRVHSQVAPLLAVWWPDGRMGNPCVVVFDEAVGEGNTTEDQDADAILRMLERNGLRWRQLTAAHGDRPHYGTNRRGSIAKKSNDKLMEALRRHPRARRHGIGKNGMNPVIKKAKTGAAAQPGSVSYGCTWLHRLMLRPGHFGIMERCKFTLESMLSYDMTPNSDQSHFVDAIRYGLRPLIYGKRARMPDPPLVIV